jgi:hypothetical protein
VEAENGQTYRILANGTRGTIPNIIIDMRETITEPDEDGTIKLKYPPSLILFEPEGALKYRLFLSTKEKGEVWKFPRDRSP